MSCFYNKGGSGFIYIKGGAERLYIFLGVYFFITKGGAELLRRGSGALHCLRNNPPLKPPATRYCKDSRADNPPARRSLSGARAFVTHKSSDSWADNPPANAHPQKPCLPLPRANQVHECHKRLYEIRRGAKNLPRQQISLVARGKRWQIPRWDKTLDTRNRLAHPRHPRIVRKIRYVIFDQNIYSNFSMKS